MKANVNVSLNQKPAYAAVFLEDMVWAHRDGFLLFNKDEVYKVSSLIDTYMRTSNCRSGMDNGGTRWLGYAGGGTIVSYTDKSLCEKGTEKMDDDTLRWMAEAYVVFQWKYCLKSKDISEVFPAKRMEKMCNEMKALPMDVVCNKLFEMYEKEKSKID